MAIPPAAPGWTGILYLAWYGYRPYRCRYRHETSGFGYERRVVNDHYSIAVDHNFSNDCRYSNGCRFSDGCRYSNGCRLVDGYYELANDHGSIAGRHYTIFHDSIVDCRGPGDDNSRHDNSRDDNESHDISRKTRDSRFSSTRRRDGPYACPFDRSTQDDKPPGPDSHQALHPCRWRQQPLRG